MNVGMRTLYGSFRAEGSSSAEHAEGFCQTVVAYQHETMVLKAGN